MQYGMIIDLEKCVGCHACAIACKAEWDVPVEYGRNWVHNLGPAISDGQMASTNYPGLCNHCTHPACTPVCPADKIKATFKDTITGATKTMEIAATWKDPFDGTVQIDKNRCLGCGACVDACPYGARYVNPNLTDDVSDAGKADKCTYCRPRVEAGAPPACVQTCITGARVFGDLDDPASDVAQYVKKGAKGLEPKGGNLDPNSRYYGKKKNMDLLFATSTPELADMEPIHRRALLASLGNKAKRAVSGTSLFGIAGALMVAGKLQNEKEKDE